MKIVTWNINSVRAREDRLLAWLEKVQPDVLCLQEIKCETDQFPYESVREAGYYCSVYGQKTYNGVAILSRKEPTDFQSGMGSSDDDPQARVASVLIDGVRIIDTYFPNGKSVGTEEYGYKLQWMGRLLDYLSELADAKEPVALVGDFNVAPEDTDVARPDAWGDSVLCHPSVREALEKIRAWGFTDVFRKHHPDGGVYSWWDYRMLAFPKNVGLRIDHIFATESLAETSVECWVDRDERKKGSFGKPSDHAPVIGEFHWSGSS